MADRVPVLWEVVEEHLDEAGFLWTTWERTLGSPLLRPVQVAARFEERLVANLEGLAVNAAVERVLLPALAASDAGMVAAAASALLALPEGLPLVLDSLRSADGAKRKGLTRALALSRRPELERDLWAKLKDDSPTLVAGALEALAFRRVDVGPALLQLLQVASSDLRAAALRAARATAQPVRRQVETACTSEVAAIREAAIETGLLLGFRAAFTVCQKLADARDLGSGFPLAVLAISGDPADIRRIEAALEAPEHRRAALIALGYAGRTASMPTLLAWAGERDLARLSGEAFSAITGVAVEGALKIQQLPEEDQEEEDLDANLDQGPEGELPVPDADELELRWQGEEKRFDPALRYIGGKPFSPETLREVFLAGSMRRRPLLGLELAVRSRRGFWVETSGWAAGQLREEQRQRLEIRSEAKSSFSRFMEA